MITYHIIRDNPIQRCTIQVTAPRCSAMFCIPDNLFQKFGEFAKKVLDYQSDLMRAEYVSVLHDLEDYSKGKRTSFRAISAATAEYAYRLNVYSHEEEIMVELPSSEATYKVKRNLSKASRNITLKDIQFISTVNSELPPLDEELADVYQFILQDLVKEDIKNKEIAQ